MKGKFWKSLMGLGLLIGCNGLSIKKEIVKNYYLVVSDDISELALSYHLPSDENNYPFVIGPQITAIGFNRNFLIAKQKAMKIGLAVKTTDKENYFILPLKDSMDWKTMNGLMGPLSLNQFKRKMDSLGLLQNLKFTKEF